MNSCTKCGIELPETELWNRYPDNGSIASGIHGAEPLIYCSNCKHRIELKNSNTSFVERKSN